MKIRMTQRSDGRTQMWRWPAGAGDNYQGPLVEMTTTHKNLSPRRIAELERIEARVYKADETIRRNSGG